MLPRTEVCSYGENEADFRMRLDIWLTWIGKVVRRKLGRHKDVAKQRNFGQASRTGYLGGHSTVGKGPH